MDSINKYIVPGGLLLSILLMVIAGITYPGGSIHDAHTTGYSWTDNYISNLLAYNALNGMPNPARPFAVAGAVLMGLAMGFAFVRFADKADIRQYSLVIKYLGFLLIGFSILITVPSLHDLMVTLSSIASLLVFFYITALLLKTRLLVLKTMSVLFLLSFYGAAYMYFTRTGLDYLPAVQKTIHIIQIIWILGLEYFTAKEDFAGLQKKS